MKRALLVILVIGSLVALSAPTSFAAAQGGASEVIPLGFAVHQGRLVEGIAFVQGRGNAPKGGPTKSSPLYTFLGRGAVWRTAEPYVVNASNNDGVASSLITGGLEAATATWESTVTANIFGAGSLTNEPLAADWNAPDGLNEVYFSQSELRPGTVAVTIVWGVFSGPADQREIIEADLVFNDGLPESWGDADVESGVWDVKNIATHELGHSAGLGDLYTTAAAQQTMYGYASPGEVKKRTLESGDAAGIKALYP